MTEECRETYRQKRRERYLKTHPNAKRYEKRDKCEHYAEWGACFKCPYADCVLIEGGKLLKGLFPEGVKPHTTAMDSPVLKEPSGRKRGRPPVPRPPQTGSLQGRLRERWELPTVEEFYIVSRIFGV